MTNRWREALAARKKSAVCTVPETKRLCSCALLIPRCPRRVLLIAHRLHPIDDLAIDGLLNSDVSHRGSRRRTVPVFDARRDPNNVTRLDRLNRPAPLLNKPGAGRDDEDLAHGMRVPHRARAGLERDAPARGMPPSLRRKQLIDLHMTGE